ncbi:hypothetical protein PU629_06680 [Pullulanibacillus sp. KACC 23026]|uniref:hypothetical protein n=1 Tax=Pullulanibacillus sp. KACC 23026 TaxID=3028315 RepID=UPI0023B0A9C4|nr:hypothetical protein [Pullulanibacillus sp. KACC 23026]WEG14049.1 hypothetical protein PU629_06680 [Pullulanibacillus sp. KACC 23026]
MSESNTPKKNPNNRITVTFNGKETTLHKWAKEAVAATDQDRMKDWRLVGLESQEEPQSSLDRQEMTEEPVVEEEELNSFNYYEINNAVAKPYLSPSYSKKKKKPVKKTVKSDFVLFFKKFWIPLISAIIVGLGLGFTVLVFFTHQQTTPAAQSSSTPDETAGSEAATTSTPVSDGKTETVDGKDYALNLYIDQLNMYSTKANAQNAQKTFSSQGIHSVIVQEQGKYALIGAVALTKADLQTVGKPIASQVDVYGKQWILSVNQLKGSHMDLQDIKTANLVIQNLIPLSLSAAESKPVDQTVMKQVNKAIQQMEDPGTDVSKQKLGTLKGTLVAAYSALNQSKPSGTEAQKALLDAIANYQLALDAYSSK